MGWIATVVALCAALVTAGQSAGAQSRPAAGPARRAPAAAGAASAPAASVAPAAEGQVNINTATEEELRRLPGVGPARASAIVSLRQRVQRFRAPDDLMRVRGIGRAGMRRLRPYVTLTGQTTLASRPGHAPRSAHAAPGAGAASATSREGGQQSR